MGTRPCRQRAARFSAGALLALQLSFIASIPYDSATAESGNASAGAAIVSRSVTAGPAEARRSTIIGVYDIATLEIARRYAHRLCRRAHRGHRADPGNLEVTAPLWAGNAASGDTPPKPSGTAARTRSTAPAGEHREKAAPQRPGTAARTRTAALTGASGEQAATQTAGTASQATGTASQTSGKARAPQAQEGAQAPPPAEQALAAPAEPAEANPQQAQQARHPARLQQTDAKRLLKAAGLRWTSSGKCANRQGRTCTSLEAVRATTVTSAIDLKRRSGCPIVVTGGTEVGHAPGPYSHYEGYKLDIKPNACVNRYITKNYPPQGVRGDGARLYGRSATSGPLFAREANHWDILFR
ncbi:hypothetical protein [Streptosporangium sp. NPDC048865]|uniref:hypothetical protein n=1 Tax=Streptosporangium sp. NPDC048865 TaxID=3155766 RepID=UPI003433821B